MTDEQTPDQQPVTDTGESSKAVTQQPLEPNHQNDPSDGYTSRPVALITDPAPLPPDTNLAQVIGTPGPLGLGGANDPDQGGINAHLIDGNAPGLGGGQPIANQGGDSFIEAAAGLPTFDKRAGEDYFRSDVLTEDTATTPGPNAEQVFPTGTYGPVGEQVQPTGQPVQEVDASNEHATSANLVDEAVIEEALSGSAQAANTNQQEVAAPQPEGAVPSTLDTGDAQPNAADESITTFEPGASTSEPYEPTFTDKTAAAAGTDQSAEYPREVELPASTGPDPEATDERGGPIDTSATDVPVGTVPAAPLATEVDHAAEAQGSDIQDVPTDGGSLEGTAEATSPETTEEDPHGAGTDEDDEATVVQDTAPETPTVSSYDASTDPVLTDSQPSQYAADEEQHPEQTIPADDYEVDADGNPVIDGPVDDGTPAQDEPVDLTGVEPAAPVAEPTDTLEATPEDEAGQVEPAVEDQPTEADEPLQADEIGEGRDHTVMPSRNDRKEDWYDYAQTKGYVGEYEDHTKQWFIANFGSGQSAE